MVVLLYTIMKTDIRPFHLAIPVTNLETAKKFYINLLDCKIGRSSNSWIDLFFFGHQLVLHLSKKNKFDEKTNYVDGKQIPIPHFGIILAWEEWEKLAYQIKDKIDFKVKPYIRFKGEIGEQATMFFLDTDGNALEFKAFKNDKMIFEK